MMDKKVIVSLECSRLVLLEIHTDRLTEYSHTRTHTNESKHTHKINHTHTHTVCVTKDTTLCRHADELVVILIKI